jgi:AcrR family transcriptional regulator
MSRRPRNAEATQKAILEAAESLFIENGFGSTSLSQIGRACGCANSLILHHYKNKAGLWNAVKDRTFSSFIEEQSRIFGDNPVSLGDLRQTTTAYFRFLQREPGLVQLLIRAELERDLSFNQFNQEQLAPFVARMREAQKAGLLRQDVPVAHLLLIIINVITRWFEARHLFENWEELEKGDLDEQFLDSVVRVLFEGALAGHEGVVL